MRYLIFILLVSLLCSCDFVGETSYYFYCAQLTREDVPTQHISNLLIFPGGATPTEAYEDMLAKIEKHQKLYRADGYRILSFNKVE